METNLTTSIKQYLQRDDVKAKFIEILGKRSSAFLSSVLAVVSQSAMLANAKPESVYMCAMMAATLDLPINQNLGFAYIIPYNQKQKDNSYIQVAQFQMGVKGFIQLALRSGQFKTISSCPICEGQLIEENPLTGFVFDFTKKSNKVIGYAAYFSLINGFEKTFYMTIEQIKSHGKKYSKTFDNKYGLWTTDFEAMALKTVTKLLLSKYAPLSVEMQKAILTDQSVINNAETVDVTYVDNNLESIDIDKVNYEKERNRIIEHIKGASIEDLDLLKSTCADYNIEEIINQRKNELKSKK